MKLKINRKGSKKKRKQKKNGKEIIQIEEQIITGFLAKAKT